MKLVETAYLIAPLLVAGAVLAPVIKLDLVPSLARPLDLGRSFRGCRIFGTNKTWRGVLVMSGVSVLIVLAQSRLYDIEAFRAVSMLDYHRTNPLVLGLVLGLSYSLSELPNSFAKRRLGIAPGAVSGRHRVVQYVIDQADSPAGGTLALALFLGTGAETLLLVFAVGFCLHVAMDRLYFLFAVKRRSSVAAVSPTC